MISAWSPEKRVLDGSLELAGARWLHAVSPTREECERLTKEFSVPGEFLEHVLDPDEVARLDHDSGGASLVVIRVPWVREEHGVPYRTAPVGVVLMRDLVVTVTPVTNDVVARLGPLTSLEPSMPGRFVLHLLARVAGRFLADVRDIDRRVDELEDRLEVSLRNEEVLRLLKYQKGLVHFETALASNRIMLESLQRDERFHKTKEDEALLDDVLVEFRQASEMAAISTNILSQMMDAFASIISNNLNVVMKLLTALTLLFAIPTVVASLFGMNVALPLQRHPLAFVMTLGVSVALVVAVALFFRRRRWL